jgi:hypothetical protein
LQDRQQFVLGGLEDDHLSTFVGLSGVSLRQAPISKSACIFAVFWPQKDQKTCQTHEIEASSQLAWGFSP